MGLPNWWSTLGEGTDFRGIILVFLHFIGLITFFISLIDYHDEHEDKDGREHL